LDVADDLNHLGRLLHDLGDYAGACPLLERSLAIREKVLGPTHPDVAWTATNLAIALQRTGHPDRARELYERALSIWVHALGPDHPDAGWALYNLADLEWQLGRWSEAFETSLRHERLSRGHLRLMAATMAERQALAYAGTKGSRIDLALSLLDRLPPSASRAAFDAVIRTRAVVLDEMAARHHVARVPRDTALVRLEGALASASTRYANLLVRVPGAADPQPYLRLLEQARREKEDAEQALAEKSVSFRTRQRKDRVG